jgi:LacI family transcriptional regulator
VTTYPSLRDVAARSGVSFQTASKVLGGRAGAASADTADRVLQAARELGYVPSALARGLVNRSGPVVGIISDDIADLGLSQFLIGAQRAVHARGKEAFVVTIQAGGDSTLSVRKLLEHRVDGILVLAPSVEHDRHFGRSLRAELPLVSLNHFPGSDATLVGSDHAQTGALAAAYLLRNGHRRIATITGPLTRQVVERRLEGFRRVLTEANVRLPKRRIVEADWSSDQARAAMHTLLDADPTISAVFVHNDVMAMGAIRAAADRGVRVPDDCSVIGCDDMPFAAFLVPTLTTVKVPFQETGARAAELLLDKINGTKIPSRVLLPVGLIERQSTASPRMTAARAPRGTAGRDTRTSRRSTHEDGEQ